MCTFDCHSFGVMHMRNEFESCHVDPFQKCFQRKAVRLRICTSLKCWWLPMIDYPSGSKSIQIRNMKYFDMHIHDTSTSISFFF